MVVLLAVFIGVSMWGIVGHASEVRPPVPVNVQPLSALIIHPVRDAPATAISLNYASISSRIEGVVDRIPVAVGDTVQEGDPVALIDCTDHTLSLEQARAALEAAKAKSRIAADQAERARRLARSSSISQERLQEQQLIAAAADAEVVRLGAAVAVAAQRVGRCSIRAPFTAVVVTRIASEGELAMPGTPIVQLLDQTRIEVSAKVQEQDLDSLRQAGELRFVSREHSYPLKLRVILPLVESKIRSYEVRLAFADAVAPPGAAGRLEWVAKTPHLPANLLVSRGGELGVMVESQGRATFSPLPGAREGRPAPIALPLETHIVTDGRYGLEDGVRLDVTIR